MLKSPGSRIALSVLAVSALSFGVNMVAQSGTQSRPPGGGAATTIPLQVDESASPEAPTSQAAPGPEEDLMVTDYATRVAKSNGDGTFGGLEYVNTSRQEAVKAISGASLGEAGGTPVAVVQIHGKFTMANGKINEKPCEAPYWLAVVDPATGQPTDFTLEAEPMDLTRFGVVRKVS